MNRHDGADRVAGVNGTTPQAPVLTFVVPVHGVARYLYHCLDSIIFGLSDEEGSRIEIIAVDDASPDACGEMLEAYAARDTRVTVLHLERNVGLGLARNAGLEPATGAYVWFVDGDDWLPPGSVRAVLDRLRQARPDVLLVDHLKVHEDGTLDADASSRLLSDVPDVVTLAARPELLRLRHAAWNKVIRREFLTGLGLRFFPGWYEDVPFSHPMLIAAERIAVLDQVCYYYRQGRAGAITATGGARHFEVFDQYERLLDWVSRHTPDVALRAEIFTQMVNHYLVVAGSEERLDPTQRREFLRRASEHFRRYLPASGYSLPRGVTGLKHRLLRGNHYALYLALRLIYRASNRLRGADRLRRRRVGAHPAPSVASEQPVSGPR